MPMFVKVLVLNKKLTSCYLTVPINMCNAKSSLKVIPPVSRSCQNEFRNLNRNNVVCHPKQCYHLHQAPLISIFQSGGFCVSFLWNPTECAATVFTLTHIPKSPLCCNYIVPFKVYGRYGFLTSSWVWSGVSDWWVDFKPPFCVETFQFITMCKVC